MVKTVRQLYGHLATSSKEEPRSSRVSFQTEALTEPCVVLRLYNCGGTLKLGTFPLGLRVSRSSESWELLASANLWSDIKVGNFSPAMDRNNVRDLLQRHRICPQLIQAVPNLRDEKYARTHRDKLILEDGYVIGSLPQGILSS